MTEIMETKAKKIKDVIRSGCGPSPKDNVAVRW